MGWGATIGYIAARAVLAAATGGASEAGFLAGDALGVVFAAKDVADAIDTVAGSVDAVVTSLEQAAEDGVISPAEAEELIDQARGAVDDARDVSEAAKELQHELKRMGGASVTGRDVVEKAKRMVHCKKCGAAGVNARSHVAGHPKAHLHRF
ncbi:hypothetical protein HYH03_008676 [Edaphochlamys debaryana]|uniref:C2H2-type domain-containing protein n=1 Tax=Edaphochlamys debaryana TaxID=47281 RepID=A0A835Y1M1_9CHLO|nr:hypothetical protein HYH03_008676 [Edaphochlamys debaryana]|eukprot:KAG2493013.1 hypothetical protein HYH03_008676 [Edaphochlamys debaryana]